MLLVRGSYVFTQGVSLSITLKLFVQWLPTTYTCGVQDDIHADQKSLDFLPNNLSSYDYYPILSTTFDEINFCEYFD